VAWLTVRGSEPGPLFVNFDRAGKGEGFSGRSIARLVLALGAAVGLAVRPHGLRHAAITEALDLTSGDVRKVQRFSRHRDLRVLNLYDDNRADLGGEVARLVAATV
jgi:integrase/recombinase XerC